MHVVRVLLAALLAAALLGSLTPSAEAHALLESTVPERGAVLTTSPERIVLAFSEPVETAFGAVRVFDAQARRVDDERVGHPGGAGERIAVGLRRDLPRGTYTATYRVVSADGHPISGGLVFSVGAPGAGPAASVGELLGTTEAGPVTKGVAALARAAQYGGIALAAGLLAFLVAVWRPALRGLAGPERRWQAASEALADRALRVGLSAAGLGLLGAALSLVAEAATAGGTSLPTAVDPAALQEVAGTRTGTVLLLQLVASLLLALAIPIARPRRALALRPAALGADGQALGAPSRLALAAVALPVAALVVSPALEGHQATRSPIWANAGLDIVHVAAISVWLGGIAALLVVLPAATGRLEPTERTRLLSGVLARFSPLALVAVGLVAVSGTLAAILELGAVSDLFRDAYGRLLLVKIAGLLLLVGLGALHRRALLPRLRSLAEGAVEAPGVAGRLIRRTLRVELAVMVVVLGATGLLVATSPPGAGAAGPFSDRVALGPLELEVTVDPARTGPNELHVYLFDGKTGAPFAGTQELTITATQREAQIGPLPVALRPSGPGHYTADTVALQPAGTWELRVEERVSEFDQYETKLEVKVR